MQILTNVVQKGEQYGTKIGFPTANLYGQFTGLKDGIYAGWITIEGQRYPAAIFAGTPETLDQETWRVEAHALDYPYKELYGQTITIELAHFLRSSVKYNSQKELIEAITKDIVSVREYCAQKDVKGQK